MYSHRLYTELTVGQRELSAVSKEDIQDPEKVSQIENRTYHLFNSLRQLSLKKKAGLARHAITRRKDPVTPTRSATRDMIPLSENPDPEDDEEDKETSPSLVSVELPPSHRIVSNASIADPTQGSDETTTIDAAVESATQTFANNFMGHVHAYIWPSGIELDWVTGRKGPTHLVENPSYSSTCRSNVDSNKRISR
jgi:hypothetical protein